jgi:DNA polymerase
MLEEMGLGPVWRLRRSASSAAATSTAANAAFKNPDGEAPIDARSAPARAAATRAPAVGAAANEAPTFHTPVNHTPVNHTPANHTAAIGTPAIPADRLQRIARMSWQELKQAVAGCTACALCKTRNNTVLGVGDEKARWLIIGEAPGQEEDARGEPFVGPAGHLLDNMLAAIGLQRGSDVYIANVLKCRPPGNRNPAPDEVAACSPHLMRQIALIQPSLIVAMGRAAAQTLLHSDASIASMRGRRFEYQNVPLIVTYHPAYLLRNLADKAKAWEDLCFARSTMRELTASDPAGAGASTI